MTRPLLLALALAAGAPTAAAQFSLFTWTLDNPGDAVASVTPTTMWLVGTPWQVPGSIVKYTAVSHVAGRVTVHATVTPEDGHCTDSSALLYDDTGVPLVYADCNVSGQLTSMVWEGSSFGYGLQTVDTSWPYTVSLTGLQFTPTWTDEGGAVVPAVDIVVTGLLTGPTGTLALSTTWPAALPVGFDLLLQAWIADASAPAGWAASNGLRGVVL